MTQAMPPPVYRLTPPLTCRGGDAPCRYRAVDLVDGELSPLGAGSTAPALAWYCLDHPNASYVDLPDSLPVGYTWREMLGGRRIWHDTILRREDWHGYRDHLNTLACHYAMDLVCARDHCANGIAILRPSSPDDYRTGRLYDAQGALLPPPSDEELVCVHCLDDGYGHRMQALADEARRHTNERSWAQEKAKEARAALDDAQETAGREWRWIRTHRAELREARAYERRTQ